MRGSRQEATAVAAVAAVAGGGGGGGGGGGCGDKAEVEAAAAVALATRVGAAAPLLSPLLSPLLGEVQRVGPRRHAPPQKVRLCGSGEGEGGEGEGEGGEGEGGEGEDGEGGEDGDDGEGVAAALSGVASGRGHAVGGRCLHGLAPVLLRLLGLPARLPLVHEHQALLELRGQLPRGLEARRGGRHVEALHLPWKSGPSSTLGRPEAG